MNQKWGWYDTHKQVAQEQLFSSSDAALADMVERHGGDVSLRRLAETGFELTLFEVQLRPLMSLKPV